MLIIRTKYPDILHEFWNWGYGMKVLDISEKSGKLVALFIKRLRVLHRVSFIVDTSDLLFTSDYRFGVLSAEDTFLSLLFVGKISTGTLFRNMHETFIG